MGGPRGVEGALDVGTAATNPRDNGFSAEEACMKLARSSGDTIGGMKRIIDSEAEHSTDVVLCPLSRRSEYWDEPRYGLRGQ